ncbi:MAG: choice-of-anchor tandem repeat NxxGxxAF-containing protein [Planctomycetota bacterium]
MSNTQYRKLALLAVASLGSLASAQSILLTNGRVIAAVDGQVPGVATGILWGGSGNFDNPVIDASGNVLFRGRMIDTSGLLGVTPLNDRGIFYGPSMAGLQLVARGSDPAPTLPGLTLNTSTSTQVGGSPRLSENGNLWWCAPLSGSGVLTTNDTAVFGGPIGSQGVMVREGDQLPGAAAGTAMSSTFSNLSQQPTGINNQGRVLFQTATLGGDTQTSNNAAWVTGIPGSLEVVQRKGDTVLGGAVISALGSVSQMNDSGQVLHDETLSTTLGSTPATTANDKTLWVYTPGSGNALLLREGDPAPGTAGATFNNASNSWSVSTGSNAFTSNGDMILNAELYNGDVVAGQNDRAVYLCGTGGPQLVLRRGTPTGIPGVNYDLANNSSQNLTEGGLMAFQCSLSGLVTSADDGAVVTGTLGNLNLVLREGDPAPGTAGAIISSFLSQFMIMNERGQILLRADLSGGDTTFTPNNNSGAVFLYDPNVGWRLMVRLYDSVEVSPGVFKNVSSIGSIQFNNGAASPLSFNKNGQFATRLGFTDGSAAIVVIDPPSSASSFCAGDGIATDHTTPCPCGNNGAAGNGCANSTNANGANCAVSGSTFLDTATLEGSGMPATSSCIYLQGDSLDDTTFGDGVRCAGGSLIRLRTRFNSGGASTFPDSTDTITLSARGGVTPGSGARRYYQIYYRNAAALFCPPETFNVSNGMVIDW